ncbi:HAD-IIA family hydrolase [Bacteroides uniformis]|jgi:HAD superfamily hydrolase (TIGR01457 family)|uniref:HAD-IIA family hydrolase n=1 Tax=Bacteroides uniformis TaxID=820 RepID=A0A1Y3V2W4_BACUN|nr:HAD-IIA family hydrolase [Bacteroides uniformis]OUN55421.1 hypothetical protein B5G17_06805 [Bacteroides uniformis]
MAFLKSKKLFLFDMDGTIYHEDTLIPGASDFFYLCVARGIHYVFMTNNSSKSKYSYVEKLNRLGIDATIDNIASSINATVDYLKGHNSKAKIYLVGTESFKEELEKEGFEIVPWNYREMDIDYVLVGFDTELDYNKIEGACFYISRGFDYIATNCDLRCPVRDEKYIPDCGAICQLLETATNRKPLFLGKPSPYIVESVLEKWNVHKEDIVCVGDRLYTDIAVGINAGVDTVLVLTGEAKMEDLSDTPFSPTYTFDSIKDIYLDVL